MSVVFGPVASRRFGVSLGIDVVGNGAKQCNFDCLYCELPIGEKVRALPSVLPVEKIVSDVKAALADGGKIEVLTVTANGEPTLYPHLKELAKQLCTIKGDAKLLILSNGGTICDEKVQEALLEFDIVKLSLDCATAQCFKKIDRPIDCGIEELIECMSAFRQRFNKELIIETLFVEGINDSEQEAKAINAALAKIKPDRLDIGTIDRPPAYAVKPVSMEALLNLRECFEGLNVSIAYRKTEKVAKNSYDQPAIISTLKNRPLTDADVEALMDEGSKELFYRVVNELGVQTKSLAGVRFYNISEKMR